MLLSPVRHGMNDSCSFTYPFGYSPTQNVLEGVDCSDTLLSDDTLKVIYMIFTI